MPVTPTGPLATPLANLRDLVAASAAFQAWTGTADAAAAAGRVHLVGLPPAAAAFTAAELAAMRPFALVDLWSPDRAWGGEPWVAAKVAEVTYTLGGKLALDFVAGVDPADARHYGDSKVDFLNECGAVLQDLLGLANAGGALSVHKVELYQGPVRCEPDDGQTQGDFWRAQFVVHWGI